MAANAKGEWREDPTERFRFRWWAGQWTNQVWQGGQNEPEIDPAPIPYRPAWTAAPTAELEPTTATPWEYLVEQFTVADRWTVKSQAAEMQRLNARWNQLGALGWEMVSYEAIPALRRLHAEVEELPVPCVLQEAARSG
jgi:hypothetical protein